MNDAQAVLIVITILVGLVRAYLIARAEGYGFIKMVFRPSWFFLPYKPPNGQLAGKAILFNRLLWLFYCLLAIFILSFLL